jgi:hypothetical protein
MKQVKILFEYYDTTNNEYSIESVWATPFGNGYKIDNILFYANEYSWGDIVSVENRNNELYVIDLLEASGHSTVRIIFYDYNIIPSTRLQLQSLGCSSEISDNANLISVDIPFSADYSIVRDYLEEGENSEIWSYEESCIAHDI